MRMAIICGAAMLLTACATTGASEPAASPETAGQCDAAPIADLVGQEASAALATDAMARSGARTIRWAQPNSALTMDYRQDRLTIGLDAQNKVSTLNCG